MLTNIAINHPKQRLIFCVVKKHGHLFETEIHDFICRLAPLTNWVIGPPQCIDMRNTNSLMLQADSPIENVGGCLELYSALPPWILPRETDLNHLTEVTILIDKLCEFSRKHDVSIEFELDGELIGAIDNGNMDRSLAEGLLGEWRRHLGVS